MCATQSDEHLDCGDSSNESTNSTSDQSQTQKRCEKSRNAEKSSQRCLKYDPCLRHGLPSPSVSDSTSHSEPTGDENGKKSKAKKSRSENAQKPVTDSSSSERSKCSERTQEDAVISSSRNQSSASGEVDSSSKALHSSVGDSQAVSSWTTFEDHLLRGLKETTDNVCWKEIAYALHREQNEVKARWAAIKDCQSRSSIEGSLSGSAGNKKVCPPVKKKKNQEGNKNKQPHRQISATPIHTLVTPGISSTDTTSSPTPSEEAELYRPTEAQAQVRYSQKHIWPKLYPHAIRPPPDAYFTKRDCDILAAVDSKYKRSKWLEMQANFYNVTGRMVPLDVIRRKCDAAEKLEKGGWVGPAGAEAGSGERCADGNGKVWAWMAELDEHEGKDG